MGKNSNTTGETFVDEHNEDDGAGVNPVDSDESLSVTNSPKEKAVTKSVLKTPKEDDDNGEDEDDSNLESSGTTSGRRQSEIMEPKIAAKEAKAVFASKFLVAFVLLLSAGLLGFFSYTYTRDQEQSDFESKFMDYADEIISSSHQNADNSYTILETYARTVTSLAAFSNQTWPFVTLPDFEVRANDYMTVSKVEELAFAPIVQDRDREQWEAYTVAHQDWIQEGLDYRYMLTLMNKKVTSSSTTTTTTTATSRKATPPTTIAPGTNMEGFTTLNQAKPIQPFIWVHAPLTHRAIPEQSRGPHVPIWQTYPAPHNSYVVNHNLMSTPDFNQLISLAALNGTTVLSDIVDNFMLFGTAQTISLDPKSVVIQPIHQGLDKTGAPPTPVVGFMIVIKKWEIYFQNVLYNGAEPISVVLRNSCGKAFSFELLGPEAYFLGEGDLHDDRYSDMVVISNFDHPNVESECDYQIYIYPTQSMEDSYLTTMPIYVTMAVCVVFVFTTLVFILYDFFVTKRQQKTMASANATNRIVSNLFPKAVRDRLIEEMGATDADNASVGSGSANTGFASKFSKASKNTRNTTFQNITKGINDKITDSLHGANHSAAHGNGNKRNGGHAGQTSEDIFGSKPIAELFPETTIMFADMAGFTAWSSIREPTQVFTLLETIYHSFDTIAKRRRVFKVETIGDCYVAVTGLPTPRKDHAVVMARFASECLSKMATQVKSLEAALGPDTGDLALRVGLHSGAVTAGVLRGEKGRFQLFGDTMNTASRMESTGTPGRIQVSLATADLLIASKKENWIREREEKVHAKGKGDLQTFWLQINTGSVSDFSAANKSVNSGNEMEGTAKDAMGAGTRHADSSFAGGDEAVLMTIAEKAKTKRLVDWNAEILVKLLHQVIVARAAKKNKKKQLGILHVGGATKEAPVDMTFERVSPAGQPIDEVKDIITLPLYDAKAFSKHVDPDSIEVPQVVVAQLHAYVARIAAMYKNNFFHNFDHASHVTMSVTKLLSRIVQPKFDGADDSETNKILHDHTFGITSDPLTQFACVLSALIHDAEHTGVSNSVLVQENDPLALKYSGKSVAEQNSVDLAWAQLMSPEFNELRQAIYSTKDEFLRFRQIITNIVLATDIMDKELGAQRKARWEKAFSGVNNDDAKSIKSSNGDLFALDEKSQSEDVNRKATIVLEHLIQASDVSHTMQHWHVYRKWNERLFCEVYQGYVDGRMATDPSVAWYKGEIGFFDFYIIPLAKKLDTCGVFGVASSEYLQYAEANRREWAEKGESIVADYLKKYKKQTQS